MELNHDDTIKNDLRLLSAMTCHSRAAELGGIDARTGSWTLHRIMKRALDLQSVLATVCDEASFIAFLAALSEDWEDEQRKEAANPSSPYGPGANGWENGSIGSFLEAASAWGSDNLNHPGSSQLRHSNPWRQAAEILYCGKIYE